MDKVLIVTGGSRGIGKAIAVIAAAEGWKTAISYVQRRDAADAVVKEIREAGGQAIAVQGDTAEEADVLRLFDRTQAEFGPVTGLVNNAGIIGDFTRVDNLTAANLRRVMDVNVNGAFFCAREAVRRMSTAHGGQGGVIVNIASVGAALGGAGELVHYAASKAAVVTMTIGLAREVVREGVRVNCVSPGMTETDMNPADRIDRVAGMVPAGRAGDPDEIARVVVFLLSPAASYMVGANVVVSGGR